MLLFTKLESVSPTKSKIIVTKKFELVITTGQLLEEKDNLFYV